MFSCFQLYGELTVCFERLKDSETQLQQSQASLQNQLLEKEQKIHQLEEQLQQAINSVASPQEICSKQRGQVKERLSSQTEVF